MEENTELPEQMQNVRNEGIFTGHNGGKNENPVLRWIREGGDSRQESYISREQASAIPAALSASKIVEQKFVGDYVLFNSSDMQNYIDDILNINVSIDGQGRKEQADVLTGSGGGSESESVIKTFDMSDKNE